MNKITNLKINIKKYMIIQFKKINNMKYNQIMQIYFREIKIK